MLRRAEVVLVVLPLYVALGLPVTYSNYGYGHPQVLLVWAAGLVAMLGGWFLVERSVELERVKSCGNDIMENVGLQDRGAGETVMKTLRIVYGTTTNTAKGYAGRLMGRCRKEFPNVEVDMVDLGEYDQDNLEGEDRVVFIISTWTGGNPPDSCIAFFDWLRDMSTDFRVDKLQFLSTLRFAVFGLGNKDYDEHFCAAGMEIAQLLENLGAARIIKTGLGNDAEEMDKVFEAWCTALIDRLCVNHAPSMNVEKTKSTKKRAAAPRKDKIDQSREEVPIDIEDIINEKYLRADFDDDVEPLEGKGLELTNNSSMPITDLEDLILSSNDNENGGPREMVTASQRKALTKEGYKIIGTHSAVKLCRWTKHQLRGRGGCYKHSFYGITSYQCMEATPSLACANKCVFCWRHHKNPVGKEWRWKTDDPEFIVKEAIANHQKMIKEYGGTPGVKMERLEDAFNVQHCALSLVGEPVMYPRINELIKELHDRGISTFLVCNAQFPQQLLDLHPVTQLYVSIDAATKDALKDIDRPLHKDFWERFIRCLEIVREKKQRTVYRLTLVKKWNIDQKDIDEELDAFAKLIEIGEPDFIEIKGVTYSGKSDASNLSMNNVPYHEEVREFSQALCDRTNGLYGTACEHVHSCCTLLALTQKFYKPEEGGWHTFIDYPKFIQLVQGYYASNGAKQFTTQDYLAKTPSWALWGASEQGFDPEETRFKRTRNKTHNNPKPDASQPPSSSSSS